MVHSSFNEVVYCFCVVHDCICEQEYIASVLYMIESNLLGSGLVQLVLWTSNYVSYCNLVVYVSIADSKKCMQFEYTLGCYFSSLCSWYLQCYFAPLLLRILVSIICWDVEKTQFRKGTWHGPVGWKRNSIVTLYYVLTVIDGIIHCYHSECPLS